MTTIQIALTSDGIQRVRTGLFDVGIISVHFTNHYRQRPLHQWRTHGRGEGGLGVNPPH